MRHKKGTSMITFLAVVALLVLALFFGKWLILLWLPWWALALLLLAGVVGAIIETLTKKP
jgi:hypothetical protein